MRAPTLTRRAALAAAALPGLTATATVPSVPAADMRPLALANAIREAEAALDATVRAVSDAHGQPEEGALEAAIIPTSERLNTVLRQTAAIPAEGMLGLAVKGTIVARAIDHGASIAEMELGDSLRDVVCRLFPELAELGSISQEDLARLSPTLAEVEQ